MRTRLMRISVVVAAFVFLAVVPSRAQGRQPVILEAIVSAGGTTLFVSGFNLGLGEQWNRKYGRRLDLGPPE